MSTSLGGLPEPDARPARRRLAAALPLLRYIPGLPLVAASQSQPSIVAPVGEELERAVALALGQDGRPAPRQAARSLLASAALADGGDAVRAVRAGPPGSRLLYATVPVRSPGRTTLLLMNGRLPRGVSDAASLGVAGAVDAACQTQAASGARLAQALLPDGDGPLARLLLGRAGFSRLAELLYLQRQARTRPGPAALPEGFSLARYGPRTHAAFAEAIEASYVDSLDCPALAGLRTIDDVIAGHKAAGLFRPDWWTLILRDGRPAGAMLLAGLGAGGQLGAELVYLGLAPAARGCGLSAPLLARAEAAAATTAGRLLALAVDSNNAPALKAYRRAGFSQTQRRTALLRVL